MLVILWLTKLDRWVQPLGVFMTSKVWVFLFIVITDRFNNTKLIEHGISSQLTQISQRERERERERESSSSSSSILDQWSWWLSEELDNICTHLLLSALNKNTHQHFFTITIIYDSFSLGSPTPLFTLPSHPMRLTFSQYLNPLFCFHGPNYQTPYSHL